MGTFHYVECKQWYAFDDDGGDMVGSIFYNPDAELYSVSVGSCADAQQEVGTADTFEFAHKMLRAALAGQLEEFLKFKPENN